MIIRAGLPTPAHLQRLERQTTGTFDLLAKSLLKCLDLVCTVFNFSLHCFLMLVCIVFLFICLQFTFVGHTPLRLCAHPRTNQNLLETHEKVILPSQTEKKAPVATIACRCPFGDALEELLGQRPSSQANHHGVDIGFESPSGELY